MTDKRRNIGAVTFFLALVVFVLGIPLLLGYLMQDGLRSGPPKDEVAVRDFVDTLRQQFDVDLVNVAFNEMKTDWHDVNERWWLRTRTLTGDERERVKAGLKYASEHPNGKTGWTCVVAPIDSIPSRLAIPSDSPQWWHEEWQGAATRYLISDGSESKYAVVFSPANRLSIVRLPDGRR